MNSMMKPTTKWTCNICNLQALDRRYFLSVCGHVYCNICLTSRLPDSSRKYTCAKCKTKLRRDTFFHTANDDTNYEKSVEKAEKKIFKVLDYTREDFDSVQNYNYFIEYRDNLVFNLVFKNDVNAQKEKLRDHEEFRKEKGILKKKKINPDDEKKYKQKYIIEEFVRIRKRMARREVLTSKRLNGTITVENCQIEGFQIEQEDFLLAQKERGVFLRNMLPANTVSNPITYQPSNLHTFIETAQPVPVNIDQAKMIIKTTSEGANADLEAWKKLNKDEQRKSKLAGGWSEMLFYERSKYEALWNFISFENK